MTRYAVLIAGTVLWAAPLLLALAMVSSAAPDLTAWSGFLSHPQLPGGLALALWTGSMGLVLALAAGVLVVMALYNTSLWQHLPLASGAALAVPHLAFAIGYNFLVMPSGLAARLLVGGDAPPAWVITQDPLGLSLIAVLALKETPFLALLLWSALSQGDGARLFEGQTRAARSLGHGSRSVWLRVLLPQLLRRIAGPIAVVWVYGVTVVDLALVAGPTQPPTASVVIWTLLNDVAAEVYRQGVAGAVALTLVLAILGAAVLLVLRSMKGLTGTFITRGPLPAPLRRAPGLVVAALIFATYVAVALVLALWSLAPRWPYPSLMPETFSAAAWMMISWPAMAESLFLALATSFTAVAIVILWFETWPAAKDRPVILLAMLALGLPAIAIVAGQYQLFLRLGLTGTQAGLFLAHLTPVFAYAFIVLRGAYRSFDNRLVAVSRSLGTTPARTWIKVKLPLLRAPLAMALAVGFAASLVQFVPSQLIAAGRFSTLPMEAVTLSSGGNRSLLAAHALALTFPAAFAFALAGYFGRPRWR